MPRPKKTKEGTVAMPIEVKKPAEIRKENREMIRKEQNTLLRKQMVLKEAIKSEDSRRLQAIERKLKMETKSLPINIQKLIGSLKKAVRNTMRYKGGTPFSIVRDLFIYWDADKSGEMSATELLSCMNSLGVIITLQECEEVVKYYSDLEGPLSIKNEMKYSELLKDLQIGEPTLIEYVSEAQEKEAARNEIHFEQFQESFHEMPPVVTSFIEATREWVQKLLRDVGGTPEEHIRFLFKFYDFDYSNGLYIEELLIACKRSIKLKISKEHAEEIVKYYDRKKLGQIHYESFLKDVCAHVKPVLTFTDLSPREIAKSKKSLAKNPFIPRPFKAPSNKVLEKFKRDCQKALVTKVNKLGGSIASWVRDAFIFWDPGYTRKISSIEALIGAAKRIGITLTDEDASVLIKCYDRFDSGEMHYDYLAEDLSAAAPNFLMEGKLVVDESDRLTTRSPPMVQSALKRIGKAIESLVKQSGGVLVASDLLHGCMVRYDNDQSGCLEVANFKLAVQQLRANVSDPELMACVKWFDTAGNDKLDYNMLCRQIYGNDVSTENLNLPRIADTMSFSILAEHLNKSTYGCTIEKPKRKAPIPKQNGYLSFNQTFGVRNATVAKNLDVIESEAVKRARLKQRKQVILAEKKKVEKKLASIEEQRKAVVENFKSTRMSKTRAAVAKSKLIQSPILKSKDATTKPSLITSVATAII